MTDLIPVPLIRLIRLGEFFFFLVRRYSTNIAPTCVGKSLAGRKFGKGGEAILSQFVPAGGAVFSRRAAESASRRIVIQLHRPRGRRLG